MSTASRLVVIAAAEGGLQALIRVLSSLPRDFPAAMVATVRTRNLKAPFDATLLKDHAPGQIHVASEGDPLINGKLLLAPARGQLAIRADGRLGLDLQEKSSTAQADDLFVSAARVYGSRVIGVVLSGAGHDGSSGIVAIGRGGGKSIVQSPSDAEVPGMPINAIVRDSPDHVVLLDEIGPLLQRLVAG